MRNFHHIKQRNVFQPVHTGPIRQGSAPRSRIFRPKGLRHQNQNGIPPSRHQWPKYAIEPTLPIQRRHPHL